MPINWATTGRAGSEETGGEESPEPADGVNGDGAGGVVDGESEFKQLDQQRVQCRRRVR